MAINELITVVNNALNGCPPEFTATATSRSTRTNAPTATPSETPAAGPTATPSEMPSPTVTATPTASLTGMPTDTPTAAPTDTATETPTVTPTVGTTTDSPTITPTSTPATPAMLILRVRNDSGADQMVRFSGERLSGPPPGDGVVAYGPTTSAVAIADPDPSDVPIAAQLAPGIWVHHAEVLAPALDTRSTSSRS